MRRFHWFLVLAFASLALCGFGRGFHARDSHERWTGYTLMHAGMAAA